MNIPPQLEGCNIVPTAAKGVWFIGKKDIIKKCEFLNIPFSEISPDAWSDNGDYVSWTGFWKLPEKLQENILTIETKKGLDLGFRSGEQKDGRFIIVFDCDGSHSDEYKNLLIDVYGETFIRKSESGGYHLYYTTSGPILTGKQHIDLRHYLEIDNTPMELEIKQGSFVKVQGKGRSTYLDMEIQPLDKNIDFCSVIKEHYPNTEMIKSFEETSSSSAFVDKESLSLEDNKLRDILESTYRPLYTSSKYNGLRDSGVFLATIGFLRRRGLSRSNIESVINWINSIDHEERHYDWNRTPDKMPGEPTMRRYGFDEFVDAINELFLDEPSKRQTQKVLGEYTINTVLMDYPTNHLPMFRELQDIVGIISRSHKHVLKMMYYTMVSSVNAGTIAYIHGAKHDLRISTIFIGKQGQGKTEILNTVAKCLSNMGMTVHRPTSFHAEQWIGKTRTDKKAENGIAKIMGYLHDDIIIIDEAKKLISDPDYAETRRNARISQNRYGSSPVEKKNVDTHNEDKISYDSKSILIYGVQDMKLDAEDFIIEGDVRRYAISVLDNETMDSQEDIIRSVMEDGRAYISPQVFADYLNKIPRLPDEVFIRLGSEERVLYERAVINLNNRANSYSEMVSEYFGTLGAEYLTLFLKFVVNQALIRMTANGIESKKVKICKEDILYAYVDCFEMLEHRYEWTHFYLVTESALVQKGGKYEKEIEVLSSFDIGEPVQKTDLRERIQEIYNITNRTSRDTLKKYIENGFISEINTHTIEILKLPGKRVQRQDQSAIDMYNYALDRINNIKNGLRKKHEINENSDWDQEEILESQSELRHTK